jgi:phage terminase Nu1 subunit (DNA packaging protein)
MGKKKSDTPTDDANDNLSYLVATQAGVGEFFACNTRTVAGWLARGCPGKIGGHYDLRKIQKWRNEQRRTAPEEQSERSKAMAAEAQARAEWFRLRTDTAKKRLIRLDEAQRAVEDFCNSARVQLEQLPDRVLAALAVPVKYKPHIHEVLTASVEHVGKAVQEMMNALDSTGGA